MEIVAQDEAPTVEAAQRAADRELLARGWRLAPPEFVDPVQAIAAWDQLLRENP